MSLRWELQGFCNKKNSISVGKEGEAGLGILSSRCCVGDLTLERSPIRQRITGVVLIIGDGRDDSEQSADGSRDGARLGQDARVAEGRSVR